MIKLYGLAVSNYYNVIKLALLEKGVPFEEIHQMPGQNPEYLKISATGRMPAIVCEEGALCESLAILEYLERAYPEPSLYPTSAFEAGLAMQAHCIINTSLDAAIRPHLGSAFFGRQPDREGLENMSSQLSRGAAALERVVALDKTGFLVGDHLSHADLAAINTLPLVSQVAERSGQPDPLAGIPGLSAYLERMGQRCHVQKIREDQAASLKSLVS